MTGRYQTLPLSSKSSILSWEESILQLYIFIWNMKSKVLDSQQWWSSIIIINLCSCNGLLASEGPDRRVYASEFELLNKLWWRLYIVNVCHIWWTSVIYDRLHILWMYLLMNMMDVHHVWRMDASHICMMDVHHIWCFTVINFHHICERPSWWKQWNLLVGGMNWKDMVNFEVHM